MSKPGDQYEIQGIVRGPRGQPGEKLSNKLEIFVNGRTIQPEKKTEPIEEMKEMVPHVEAKMQPRNKKHPVQEERPVNQEYSSSYAKNKHTMEKYYAEMQQKKE